MDKKCYLIFKQRVSTRNAYVMMLQYMCIYKTFRQIIIVIDDIDKTKHEIIREYIW